MFLFHNVSLSPPSPTPLSLKAMKKYPQVKMKKKSLFKKVLSKEVMTEACFKKITLPVG